MVSTGCGRSAFEGWGNSRVEGSPDAVPGGQAAGVADRTDALTERDALLDAYETKAGGTLRLLTRAEGLTLRESVQWCVGQMLLSLRDAAGVIRVPPR